MAFLVGLIGSAIILLITFKLVIYLLAKSMLMREPGNWFVWIGCAMFVFNGFYMSYHLLFGAE